MVNHHFWISMVNGDPNNKHDYRRQYQGACTYVILPKLWSFLFVPFSQGADWMLFQWSVFEVPRLPEGEAYCAAWCVRSSTCSLRPKTTLAGINDTEKMWKGDVTIFHRFPPSPKTIVSVRSLGWISSFLMVCSSTFGRSGCTCWTFSPRPCREPLHSVDYSILWRTELSSGPWGVGVCLGPMLSGKKNRLFYL